MGSGKWAIVVHGGAGVIERSRLKPEQERAYRAALAHATQVGANIVEKGGSALDAIEAAICLLEDDPLFNAGRGAAFSAEGRNELDAAIMDGATLQAGAVAGITQTKHPISLARAVMAHSPHVMLIGAPADDFATSQGLEQADPAYFYAPQRWRSLERFLVAEGMPIPEKPQGDFDLPKTELVHDEGKHGTVGVVALDRSGHVAAGTSTGGMTGKRWGRVGDSPIIGAGTYASDAACAVSATGSGEYFIRLAVAHAIAARVELKGMSLQAAVDEVIQDKLAALGGDGGVIAVAPDGQMAWSFNTPGMYRASAADGQPMIVSIYKDEL